MTLYFEDLQVGDRWLSATRTLDRDDVVDFADLTGDHDPLHGEVAETSPFGRPIVHGLLSLSVMAGLSSIEPRVKTLALVRIGEWNFERPVFFGDSVHVRTEVAELQPYGRRAGRVLWKRQLLNQDGRIVQQGTLETLVALRTPLPSKRRRQQQPTVAAET